MLLGALSSLEPPLSPVHNQPQFSWGLIKPKEKEQKGKKNHPQCHDQPQINHNQPTQLASPTRSATISPKINYLQINHNPQPQPIVAIPNMAATSSTGVAFEGAWLQSSTRISGGARWRSVEVGINQRYLLVSSSRRWRPSLFVDNWRFCSLLRAREGEREES